MIDVHQIELEKLGLSAAEAHIYLALLRKGGAFRTSAVAATTRIPRSSVYLALNSLAEMGLVEAEAGYAGRFTAVPPYRALPSLIARERDEIEQRKVELGQREQVAGDLARKLESLAEPGATNVDAEVVQVLRDPRVIAERFEGLQLEAKLQIEVFVKSPAFVRPGNPAQAKAQRHGVRCRGLYERAAIDSPEVKPHLAKWLSGGEEVRVHDGELPHKLAIFDREKILLPLIGARGQITALYIRHPQLATSLGILFDFLWEQAKPLTFLTAKQSVGRGAKAKRKKAGKGAPNNPAPSQLLGVNHHRSRSSLTGRQEAA